jgi:hypothetical protein
MPMPGLSLDLDLLASHLKSQIEHEKLSVRGAARDIGCSASTLGRMLLGSEAPNFPESSNLIRAVSWLGKSLTDYEMQVRRESTIGDVEAHLRALPDLPLDAAEGLVAMVRAVYDERKIKSRG